jgi:hypothetical protein
MNNAVRIILGLLAGIIAGMLVNSGIVSLSGKIIPLPDGIDPNDMESLKENIHLFEAKHYIIPFLAHALGTLVGAFVAAKIVLNNEMKVAMVIGIFFLAGGVTAAYMLGTPWLPNALDLVFAYIPMAVLGKRLAD